MFAGGCRNLATIKQSHLLAAEEDTVEALLEPLLRLLACDTVRSSNATLLLLAFGDTATRAAKAAVKVHAEDTNSGVVLDTQVNVLLDTC